MTSAVVQSANQQEPASQFRCCPRGFAAAGQRRYDPQGVQVDTGGHLPAAVVSAVPVGQVRSSAQDIVDDGANALAEQVVDVESDFCRKVAPHGKGDGSSRVEGIGVILPTQVAGVPVSVDNVLRLATFTGAAGFSGMTAIRFEVTDAQGARGVDTVQVTVNAAPVVVGLPQLSLRSGFSAEILLDQDVLDDGAVGSITWSAHADSGLRRDRFVGQGRHRVDCGGI